ncbi:MULTISPECIES: hypothetical protein [Bacillaceae]|nr:MULTISPECIES: hypothetical protein [Bacillaceae]
MPLYHMKEVWTPLKWMGIKIYKSYGEGEGYYMKFRDQHRKKIGF